MAPPEKRIVPNRKVAVITGSGKRRVGWYVAEAFAQRGYAIVIHYHHSAADAQESVQHFQQLGAEVLGIQADLRQEADVVRLIEETLRQFGRVDVLVNCAAIWHRRRLEEVTATDVREHFETNVLGTFLCAQQAGLVMTRQTEGGCIITCGDWAEARPYIDYGAYFASKGAIPTLTRSLAVELGLRNPKVRVNCVLPGPVLFPDDLSAQEQQQLIEATLTQSAGNPHSVAQAVLHFVDNDFTTGVCLPIDGGRSIYAP